MDGTAPAPPTRAWALTASFALSSALLIGAATVLLAAALTRSFQTALLAQGRSDTLAVAQALVARAAGELSAAPGDSLDLEGPAELARLQELLGGMVRALGLDRVALVDRDGEVIFATDPSALGLTLPREGALALALDGGAGFAVAGPGNNPLGSTGPEGERIVAAVPFVAPGAELPGGGPAGALLLTRDATALRGLQSEVVGLVARTCLSVMALLFALLAVVVWRAERRLQASAETVRRQNDQLRRNQEQLVRSNRLAAIGELAGGIAHELNNPLGGIRIFLEGLQKRADVEPHDGPAFRGECRRIFARLLGEVDRCRRIIANLLTFARQDEAAPDASADVNEVVREVLSLVELRRAASAVAVVSRLSEDVPRARISPGELGQVLMNIVTNGLQAMPGGGTLTVTTDVAPVDGKVRIVVDDTGSGIAPEHRARLFEPFFTTKPPGEGTGLGLSISYGIVTRRGGELALEPAPERGTRALVALPVRRGEEARRA